MTQLTTPALQKLTIYPRNYGLSRKQTHDPTRWREREGEREVAIPVVRIRLVRAGIEVGAYVVFPPFSSGSPAWSPWQWFVVRCQGEISGCGCCQQRWRLRPITFLEASLWLECGFLLLWHRGKPLVWLTNPATVALQRRSPLLSIVSVALEPFSEHGGRRWSCLGRWASGRDVPLVDASWTISSSVPTCCYPTCRSSLFALWWLCPERSLCCGHSSRGLAAGVKRLLRSCTRLHRLLGLLCRVLRWLRFSSSPN